MKFNISSKIAILLLAVLGVSSTALALPTSYYSASSRLANGGRWVKIKVTETGMHSISHDQLRLWGFSNPEKVNVYGYSGVSFAQDIFSESLPDDVPQIASEHVGDALYFFGESDCRVSLTTARTLKRTRNVYATYSIYYLSDSEDTIDIPTAEDTWNESVTLQTHYDFVFDEPEEANPGMGGTLYFSKPLKQGEGRTFTFRPKNYTAGRAANFAFNYVAKATAYVAPTYETAGNMTVDTSSSGTLINTVKGSNNEYNLLVFSEIPNASFVGLRLQGGEDFSLTINYPSSDAVDYFAIDYAALIFERTNILTHDPTRMCFISNATLGSKIAFAKYDENIRIWDITDPLNIVSLTPTLTNSTGGGYFVTHSEMPQVMTWAPDGEGFLTPEYVGEVTDCINLHADSPNYDMVIITTRALEKDAKTIADIHAREQGLAVKIAVQDDIFDEFSSGAPSAIGLRRYLKMLYDRDPAKLRYLLMLGAGTYDNRHIVEPDNDYLLTYQAYEDREKPIWNKYVTKNFCSDNYFAKLSDTYTPNSIHTSATLLGVGRVTASGSAADYIKKMNDYFAEIKDGVYYHRALILADDGDENKHMLMGENVATYLTNSRPEMDIVKGYQDLYDSPTNSLYDKVKEELGAGVGFVGFTGHSYYTYISMPTLFTGENAQKLPYGNHPLMVWATCHGLIFDQPLASVGAAMMNGANGPIGVISASREVYLDQNQWFYYGVAKAYADAQPGDCIGDVWRKGSTLAYTMTNSTDIAVNTLSYGLVGNPAMPVGAPDRKVKVTSINGNTSTTPETPETIIAFHSFPLSGVITDKSGNLDSDFNGTAIITLHDSHYVKTSKGYADDDSPVDVDLNEGVLARVSANVVNGAWSATLTSPQAIMPDKTNTLTVTAIDPTRKLTAVGRHEGLSITDGVPDNSDTDGPEIVEMYLNTPTFVDGDPIGSSATLYAKIAPDPSGIAMMNNGRIGFRPSVLLDNSISFEALVNALRFNADGSAELTLPLSDIRDGYHVVTLDVADNIGNHSARTIGFTVISDELSGSLSADDYIVSGTTQIRLAAPDSATPVRIIIEDASGRPVVSRENPSFPYNWNTQAFPDGLYRVTVWLKTDTRWSKTNTLEFTVIN